MDRIVNHSRRNFWLSTLAGGGALLCGGVLRAQDTPATGAARVIPVQAKKFSYTPDRITLKKGEAVVLAFTALDFAHGFWIPDLDIRADLMPGKVVNVRLLAQKAGEYDFLCDNFCGSGHEDMGGKLIVNE
jgi:cytochrome c oxidase subunit 2